MAYQLVWATDALVIGRALSAAAVAYFAIGFKLAQSARDFLRVGVRVVEPAMAALYGLGDGKGILRLFTTAARTMLLLAGPVIVYLLVVGRPFLAWWQGEEFAEASSGVLWIMSFAVVPTIAAAPLGAVYYGTNRTRPLALLVCLEAILNLGLSIALVGPLGIEGVAIGTAVPAYLVQAFLLPLVLCRYFGIPYLAFVGRTWVGPVLAGGISYFLLDAVVDPYGTYSFVALAALALLSVVLYGVVVLLLSRLAPPLFAGGKLIGVPPADAEDPS